MILAFRFCSVFFVRWTPVNGTSLDDGTVLCRWKTFLIGIVGVQSAVILYLLTWWLVFYCRFMIGQYVTVHGDVISHLNISQSKVEDGGLYSCTASNRSDNHTHMYSAAKAHTHDWFQIFKNILKTWIIYFRIFGSIFKIIFSILCLNEIWCYTGPGKVYIKVG